MEFEVFHPGRYIRPEDYPVARFAAMRAENHFPTPDNLRMNIFADASPESAWGTGGVGICYRRWLPNQLAHFVYPLSYLVPGMADTNECELVALADAILVAMDDIKRNLAIMRANSWQTSVMIWSDSHVALRYLERPDDFPRMNQGRPTAIRCLILKLISEIKTLPVKGLVGFRWVPRISTEMHRIADLMSKTPEVKAGRAPISRATKMLPSIPNSTALPLTQPTPLQNATQGLQNSKPTTSRANILEEMDAAIGRRTVNKRSEDDEVPPENILKRAAPIGIDVDRNMSRNITPLVKATTAPNNSDENDQKNSHANTESHESAAAPPSTTVSPSPADQGITSHWSMAFVDCPGHALPLAVYNLIQSYISVESFDSVRRKAGSLSGGRYGQQSMIVSAVNEQLRANEQLVAWAHSYVQSGMGSYVDLLATSLPTVAYSIVQTAVRRLPGPEKARMEAAVAEQLRVNCCRAVYQASLAYNAPQIGWSGAARTQFPFYPTTQQGRNDPQ